MISKETSAKPKFRLSKTAVSAIVLLLVLILAVGGYHLVKKIEGKGTGTGETETTSAKRLYPSFSMTGTIAYCELEVHPKDGASYRITRPSSDFIFHLSVEDELTDEYDLYAPDVVTEDQYYFSYMDIYATDTLGYYEVPRLYYLSAGVGNIYYNDVIENVEEADLKHYGLDDPTEFSVKYQETEGGEPHTVSVLIGDVTPGGKGYYVCLKDDKTKVYPTESDTLSYVTQPYSYYVKPRLVASGTSDDSSEAAYITSDFKEWKNTSFIYDPNATAGDNPVVPADLASVADVVLSLKQTAYETGYHQSDAYLVSMIKSDKFYAKLPEALRTKIETLVPGKELGLDLFSVTDVDTTSSGTFFLLEKVNTTVTYKIHTIHAVVTDGADVTSGKVGDTARYLLLTYEREDGGLHPGCLDLQKVTQTGNQAQITAIRNADIGQQQTPLSLTVQYDEDTAGSNPVIVTEITKIKNAQGETVTTVDQNASVVTYVYQVTEGGTVLVEGEATVNLADDSLMGIDALRDLFGGKTVGALTDAAIDVYCEPIYQYTQVSVGITRYVTEELIAGYAYENADKLDPFYGAETYFVNTVPGNPYGVDREVCENIARLLGGLEGDSSTSAGLYGTETLAVGLTPDVMTEYGLYANTVYYELHRGLISTTAEDGSTLRDSRYTLGTYLYVSEAQPDGTRYVGSSLYDIVTKIDASVFFFLDGTFNDTFARKTLVMVNIENVTDVKVEANFDELHGDYLVSYVDTLSGDKKYAIEVSGDYEDDDVALLSYLQKHKNTAALLDDFYKEVAGVTYYQGKLTASSKTAGLSYFREWIRILWNTQYAGELQDGDGKILDNDLLLTLTFSLNNGKEYAYKFYRVSDRQIAVRLEYPDKAPTQDFYISTFAFKKITNSFISLLNAEAVDLEAGYADGQ